MVAWNSALSRGSAVEHARWACELVTTNAVARAAGWLPDVLPLTRCTSLIAHHPRVVPPRSYFLGTHAPGRCANRTQCEEGDQIGELLKCSYHAMLAHAAVRLRQSLGVELDAYSWARMLLQHTGQCLPTASAVSHAQRTVPASR